MSDIFQELKISRVIEIISDLILIPAEQIHVEMSLGDLGLDSLRKFELLLALEGASGREYSEMEADGILRSETVKDVCVALSSVDGPCAARCKLS